MSLSKVYDGKGNEHTLAGEGGAGKDGVSATHSWDGTVLTVTSASGTSSADLKGETGETGPEGPQGPQGETGPAGSDANITADSIKNALGYTPANNETVTQLAKDKVSMAPVSVSLAAAGWSDFTQTVNANGVTENNAIIPSPAPESYALYYDCGVRCSAQENGKLTFTCDEVPGEAITVNVLIFT